MKYIYLTIATLSLAGRTTAQLPDIGPPPGQLVDVGGRRLHLLCSGAGAPTIVLEAGASAFAIDWTLVQREVARTNRVCSYDRAGSGWSDLQTATSNASVQQDLHTLLQAAGERGPYVLVGASLGGLLVRSYQADYPTEVAGLVLVDPASEDRLFTFFEGRPVLIASLTADQLRTTFPRGPIAVPRRRPQTGAPFDKLPAELYNLRIKLDERLIASVQDTVSPDAVARFRETERARLASLLAQRSKEQHYLGDLPLVALTRGVDSSPEPQQTHAALAELSRNSRHTVVPGSGHEIHLFEPRAVVEAIADVVESARTRTPLRQR